MSEAYANRDELGRFGPGNRAHVGGRPRGPSEVVQLARDASPAVMKRLINMAMGKDVLADGTEVAVRHAVSIQAAEIVLNRAYGTVPRVKADETIEGKAQFVALLPVPVANASAWAEAAAQLARPAPAEPAGEMIDVSPGNPAS